MIRVGFLPKRAPSGTIDLSAATVVSVSGELESRHGIQLCLDQETGVDLLVVHKQLLQTTHAHLLDGSIPLAIDEERDAPLMSPLVRKWLALDITCGCLKNHLYRDHKRYNDIPVPPIDLELLEVTAGYPFYDRLKELRALTINYTHPRPLDVHFAAHMTYNGSPAEIHRNTAANAVENLDGPVIRLHRGRLIPRTDYWLELLQSKICISPWGWSPACHRDAEGIYCGCVVVKPWCDDILTNPDIYRAGETYEVCLEDYSDLPEVVGRILDNWRQYEERRRDNRNWLIESSKRWRLAAHMARVYYRCLERASRD